MITLLFYRFFIKLGEKYTKDQFVSGTRLATSPKETIQSVSQSTRGASEIKLLNRIPLPMYSERQGMLFHGTTGAGKTQAMMMLLDQIRALGEPAIIYDKECTIKPYFLMSELILNSILFQPYVRIGKCGENVPILWSLAHSPPI